MRTISAKVSDEVFDFANKLAQSKNISISELIKQSLTSSKIEMGDVEKKAIHRERMYHLNRIGNNLNQIARKLNTNNVIDREILSAMVEIQKEIREIV